MTTEHIPVPVSPLQLKLKDFCIWIETKFECRLNRFGFALRMAFVAAVFYALFFVNTNWANAHGALAIPHALLFAWAAFWVILQIVRRLHDLGRTGGLFWAIAIPFWASWKIFGLYHLGDKNAADFWWAWLLLTLLSSWAIGLTYQLFFKGGTEGPNGYDGRQPKT